MITLFKRIFPLLAKEKPSPNKTKPQLYSQLGKQWDHLRAAGGC